MSNKITKEELEAFRSGKAGVRTYRTDEVTVYWKPALCIHSANCLNGLPKVFDVHRKPWIKPEEGTTADIIRVVNTCPSRALTYLRENTRPAASTKKKVRKRKAAARIQILKNGPALVTGEFVLMDGDKKKLPFDGSAAALCRCGASLKKPFCDGTHKAIHFRDDQ